MTVEAHHEVIGFYQEGFRRGNVCILSRDGEVVAMRAYFGVFSLP